MLTDNERYDCDKMFFFEHFAHKNLIYYGLSAAVPFTENAISLSSGFWVGFHKSLALALACKSLDATASAAILALLGV